MGTLLRKTMRRMARWHSESDFEEGASDFHCIAGGGSCIGELEKRLTEEAISERARIGRDEKASSRSTTASIERGNRHFAQEFLDVCVHF